MRRPKTRGMVFAYEGSPAYIRNVREEADESDEGGAEPAGAVKPGSSILTPLINGLLNTVKNQYIWNFYSKNNFKILTCWLR